MNGRLERRCKRCNARFVAWRSAVMTGTAQFCSNRCRLAALADRNRANRRSTRIERACNECSRRYWVKASYAKKARCCSRPCLGRMQSRQFAGRILKPGAKITRPCKVCATPVTEWTNYAKDGHGQFCSQRCAGFYKASHQPRPTAPERAMGRFLAMLGIEANAQHPFPGIGVVDFYVPSGALVVEVDGKYWHSMPGRRESDRRRDAALHNLGIAVVRVPAEECA